MNCFYCGREVYSTRHTRSGFRVDYYLLHTGKIQSAFFHTINDDIPTKQTDVLVDAYDIITCVDCMKHPKFKDDFNKKIKGEQ